MLELSDITKTFNPGTPNEVRALRNVSLRLETGSFLVIIGTNGSGKSTLLNAVAGTFFVDAGRIAVAGRNITRWAEHRPTVRVEGLGGARRRADEEEAEQGDLAHRERKLPIRQTRRLCFRRVHALALPY